MVSMAEVADRLTVYAGDVSNGRGRLVQPTSSTSSRDISNGWLATALSSEPCAGPDTRTSGTTSERGKAALLRPQRLEFPHGSRKPTLVYRTRS